MKINKYEIKRAESIKFLDVLLDENKIPKSVELLPKGTTFLSKQSLLSLCYIYIATLTMPMWLGEVHIWQT